MQKWEVRCQKKKSVLRIPREKNVCVLHLLTTIIRDWETIYVIWKGKLYVLGEEIKETDTIVWRYSFQLVQILGNL